MSLLGLAAWWALRDSEIAQPITRPTTPAAPAPAAQGEPSAESAQVSREPARDAPTEASSGPPPIAADSQWVDVVVLDAVTAEPAADVDVWWRNQQQEERIRAVTEAEWRSLSHADQLLTEIGWHARTDEQGQVRITALPRGYVVVMARDATRYAQSHIPLAADPPPGGHRLLLQRDRTLRVHVADAAGDDAGGVPIRLLQTGDRGREHELYGRGWLRTDERGVLTLPHAQQWRGWNNMPDYGQPIDALVVAVATPGLEQVQARVDPDEIPDEPVELRLPATGHLTVHVRFAGQVPPDPFDVALHDDPPHSSQAWRKGWTVKLDQQGTARFDHVPLDRHFSIATFYWHVEVAGPTAAGQHLETTIDFASLVYIMSGRLLDQDGARFGDRQFAYHCEFGGGGGGNGTLQTDADGRFRWILGSVHAGVGVSLASMTMTPYGDPQPRLQWTAQPRELQPGLNELGDLRMTLPRLIAGGRVIFDCGEARAVSAILECHRDDRYGWERLYEHQQAVNDDGAFELRGDVPAGRYRIAVSDQWTLPTAPVEFTLGATDLVVPVRCAHRLDIHCLLPDGVSSEALSLNLVPGADTEVIPPSDTSSPLVADRLEAMLWQYTPRPARAMFGWMALPAGSYSLEVRSGTTLLRTIPDVVVPQPSGGDPRLSPLDLSRDLATLRIHLHDPVETSLRLPDTTLAFLLPQPDDGTWRGTTLNGHEGTIVVPPGPVDVLLVPEGLRTIQLRGVEGAVDVTAEPLPVSELTIVGCEQLPEGAKLFARLAPPAFLRQQQRSYRAGGSAGYLLDLLVADHHRSFPVTDGRVTLRADADEAELDLSLRIGANGVPLRQVTPSRITLGRPTTVVLSPEELTAAAARLHKLFGSK